MLFICYPKCSTCKKAEQYLQAKGLSFTVRDIKTDNPTADELRTWYAASGLPLKRFFNTSGNLYKQLGLKDKLPTMSEDEQLELLNTELIRMGALCEDGIAQAAKVLVTRDEALRRAVDETEQEIDRKEREIEAICLRLLLQQQPVAKDLRLISAAMKMIADMERIGDQASDIAEMVEHIRAEVLPGSLHIAEMARAAVKMVTNSVDSFVRRDIDIARAVEKADDEVDALFNKVKSEIIALIAEKPEEGETCLDLLMVAKYFERIGDHAVNIAEWVVFSLTGEHD